MLLTIVLLEMCVLCSQQAFIVQHMHYPSKLIAYICIEDCIFAFDACMCIGYWMLALPIVPFSNYRLPIVSIDSCSLVSPCTFHNLAIMPRAWKAPFGQVPRGPWRCRVCCGCGRPWRAESAAGVVGHEAPSPLPVCEDDGNMVIT